MSSNNNSNSMIMSESHPQEHHQNFNADGLVSNVELFRLFNLHKRECESAGDYEAARLTQSRLIKMRNTELVRQQDFLSAKHSQETESLLETQYSEKSEFLRIWREEHLKSFFSKLHQLESQLTEKHRVELSIINAGQIALKDTPRENQSETAASATSPSTSASASVVPLNLPHNAKFSGEVLNLEERLKHVVRQGLYAQAQEISLQIARLKRQQGEKHIKQQREKLKFQEQQLKEKQMKEQKNLRDKFKSLKLDVAREQQRAYDSLKKSHQRALLSLLDKHSSEKKQLHKQQQFLRNHFGALQ